MPTCALEWYEQLTDFEKDHYELIALRFCEFARREAERNSRQQEPTDATNY